MLAVRIIAPLSCMLLAGCNEAPPNPMAVDGRYRGNYGAIQEVLDVRKDGTFDQELTWSGQVLHNRGTWQVQQLGLKFSPFYVSFSVEGKVLPQPELYSSYGADWVDYNGLRRIVFNIDIQYLVDREKAPPKP